MTERFTVDKGKDDELPVFYDKDTSISYDDVCNLLNDNNKEINRLLEVIQDLHTDIRNQNHKIRRLEQITIQLDDIIDSYNLIYQTLRER